MENRIITTDVTEEDFSLEGNLRPQSQSNVMIHWIMCCFMDLRDWERLHFPQSLPMRWEHI